MSASDPADHPVEDPAAAVATRIDYLYREYDRAAGYVDALGSGSFEDIKLLAALGALLAWPPLATSKALGGAQSDDVLLFGLLAAVFIVGILGVRNYLKLSAMEFWIREVRILEDELRKALDLSNTGILASSQRWPAWTKQRHMPIVLRFHALFALAIVVFPTLLLVGVAELWHVAIYAGTALVVLAIFLDAGRLFRRAASAPSPDAAESRCTGEKTPTGMEPL